MQVAIARFSGGDAHSIPERDNRRRGRGKKMEATIQDYPLSVQHILWRVEKLFRRKEIVTKREESVHRYTYGDFAQRVHQLAHGLEGLGIRQGDRVATLAWNNYRHLECYYAIPCMG